MLAEVQLLSSMPLRNFSDLLNFVQNGSLTMQARASDLGKCCGMLRPARLLLDISFDNFQHCISYARSGKCGRLQASANALHCVGWTTEPLFMNRNRL